jgi:hypothetical protein
MDQPYGSPPPPPPFAPAPPLAPPGAPGYYGVPAAPGYYGVPPAPPPSATKKRVLVGLAIAIVGFVVAAGIVGAVSRSSSRSLTIPAQLGSYPLLDRPELAQAKQQGEAALRSNQGVQHVAVAFYGTDQPSFLMAAASGNIKAKPDLLDNEARTTATGLQGTADPAGTTSENVNGVSMRCEPVHGTVTAFVCVHTENKLVLEGIGFNISIDDTASLVAEANHKL